MNLFLTEIDCEELDETMATQRILIFHLTLKTLIP